MPTATRRKTSDKTTETPATKAVEKPPKKTVAQESTEKKFARASKNGKQRHKSVLAVDQRALKRLKLVAVAYSHVEREMFATEEAYIAEVEVEQRAQEVLRELEKLNIPAKGYPADQYFITNLLVDDPDVVLNLVDTLKGSDLLQTSVPAALELASIPYTGAGMEGLVIGNNRHLTKQLLNAFKIPTPDFQYIQKAGTPVREDLGLPLIVKLNESGGSVGIDNDAVQETIVDAQKKVDNMITTYNIPVIVEQFIDGGEINAIVFDDGKRRHTFMAEKVFREKADGKHAFQSIEGYAEDNYFTYRMVEEPLASKVAKMCTRAFTALSHKDYAKFDIRVDEKTGEPYITDSNPNTAFGPGDGYPIADVLKLYGIPFSETLASLLSKYAKKLQRR